MKKEQYRHRVRKQLEEWVKGNPQHNHVDDECCPDFSCCKPDLLQPEEIRKTYLSANEDTKMQLLGVFLSAGLSKMCPEQSVYISGADSETTNQN